jgi:hypothetical protein
MANFFYNDSEMQFNSHLVLCIEERDIIETINGDKSIDNKIFIFWDKHVGQFFVSGKRQDVLLNENKYVPYNFSTSNINSLFDFIDLTIVSQRNGYNIIIYNYNNIKFKCLKDLSYEFFEKYQDPNYEIVGYDKIDQLISKREMIRFLKLLKNMSN